MSNLLKFWIKSVQWRIDLLSLLSCPIFTRSFMSPCSKGMNWILLTSYLMSRLCSKRIWPSSRKQFRFSTKRNRCSKTKLSHSSKCSGGITPRRRPLGNKKRIFRRSTLISSFSLFQPKKKVRFFQPDKFGWPRKRQPRGTNTRLERSKNQTKKYESINTLI